MNEYVNNGVFFVLRSVMRSRVGRTLVDVMGSRRLRTMQRQLQLLFSPAL